MNYNKAQDFINKNDHYILTAHETPDGDAIGSEIAMFEALRQLGKDVRIINADPTPRIFQFIDASSVIEIMDEQIDLPPNLADHVLLILDTNDVNNIGDVSKRILPEVKGHLIFDHHENDDPEESANLIRQDASSTCEILFDFFLELSVEITFPIAQALYSGIVYDTGSFIYPKTTARTFEIAKTLVDNGVSPNYIYSKMYESNSISSLLLQSKVLASLNLFYDGRVAVQLMSKAMLEETGAPFEEGQTLINIPLKSESIVVSVFFKENLEGILRCSLRSKGDIDVAVIAQHFNGGGHKTAAGFKGKIPLAELQDEVLEMLKIYFE